MHGKQANFPYEELTYKIIGIAMKVHRELGPGFLEAVYEEALIIEFKGAGIPFRNQVELDILYRGKRLKKRYKADFIIDTKIILDLKGINRLSEVDEACMINYLKATKLKVGLIVNFGRASLEWKRVVY